MNINLHQGSELVPKSQIETPVKKIKQESASNIKTAESPCQPILTIQDIDAQELFDNFNKIVTITSSSSQGQEEESPYRKLNFDTYQSKLNFDLTSPSMKKISPKKDQLRKHQTIKPFSLSDPSKIKQTHQLNYDNDTFSPKMPQEQVPLKQVLNTPPKKFPKSVELERAAYKQNPFRDLAANNQ